MRTSIGFIAVGLSVVALSGSGIAYGRWRSETTRVSGRLEQIAYGLEIASTRTEQLRLRLAALARTEKSNSDLLLAMREEVRAVCLALQLDSIPQDDTPSEGVATPESLTEAPVEIGDSFARIAFPPGLSVIALSGQTVEELARDERLNPSQIRLAPAAAADLNLRIVKAQGRMRQLEAEVQAAVARAIVELRERGDYIEHALGVPPPLQDPAVLTVGEQSDGNTMRLYHLYPEEFGEIYKKRGTRKAVAEGIVRELIGTLRLEAAKVNSGMKDEDR